MDVEERREGVWQLIWVYVLIVIYGSGCFGIAVGILWNPKLRFHVMERRAGDLAGLVVLGMVSFFWPIFMLWFLWDLLRGKA
jgi:hypothetical protein